MQAQQLTWYNDELNDAMQISSDEIFMNPGRRKA